LDRSRQTPHWSDPANRELGEAGVLRERDGWRAACELLYGVNLYALQIGRRQDAHGERGRLHIAFAGLRRCHEGLFENLGPQRQREGHRPIANETERSTCPDKPGQDGGELILAVREALENEPAAGTGLGHPIGRPTQRKGYAGEGGARRVLHRSPDLTGGLTARRLDCPQADQQQAHEPTIERPGM
jgi:hypothetical protein